MNQKNKRYVEKDWGKRGKVHFWIPTIVYDYNYWMCGLYLPDQNISYYHPYLLLHRTLLPMFTQLIFIMRRNGYICYVIH